MDYVKFTSVWLTFKSLQLHKSTINLISVTIGCEDT